MRTKILAAVLLGTGVLIGDPGDRFNISADRLPAPNSTAPRDIDPQFVDPPARFSPKAPAGFTISVFASGPKLTHVRWLAVAPNGDVFLSEEGAGKITLLRDADGDGKAESITTFAQGFAGPHGMAFHDGALYVADTRAIWRLPYRDGDTAFKGSPMKVTTAANLRPTGQHTTREIAFDQKGALYLTIGARKDLEEGDPAPDASVQLVAADGSMTHFAGGLRNVVGLAVQPGTGDLWGTVNERDELGAQLPPDFMARIGKDDFFGWPYAYAGPHPDPMFGPKKPDLVATTKTPEVLFEAHSAPLAVAFYDKTQFSQEYRGDAFVAFHGSGPYDKPTGYKVVRVKFTDGKPAGGYEDFVTGFFEQGKAGAKGFLQPRVWGTPSGLAVAKDGSLLIADDKGKTVWRVAYGK
jgi:glucose/arabinose dehydrogenase